MRLGGSGEPGDTAKGYQREWFAEAWRRYLPSEPEGGSTNEDAGSTEPAREDEEPEGDTRPGLRLTKFAPTGEGPWREEL